MIILGISAYYHDSAASLIIDGEIIAAAQEERFTRIKHDSEFPIQSILYCLAEADITPNDIDYIAFYDKPFLKFDRLLETYLAFAPKGFKSFATSMPVWIKDKLFQKFTIINELKDNLGRDIKWEDKLVFSEHHLSHAASAFFPSPFEDAAILTMDGVGEWATTSVSIGSGNNLNVLKEIHFPHSIGLLYSAITYYTGFKVNSGEYKVMGLAPYGKPIYASLIEDNLIHIYEDGSFHMDMSYFDYCTDLKMTNNKLNKLFGGPPRDSESEITQKEMDLAASVQQITEKIVINLARNIAKETGHSNLCLAGGVALNCVANGTLHREKLFNNIWIQPSAGDAGGSLGAALNIHYSMLNNPRIVNKNDSMKGSYLGPKFENNKIIEQLKSSGAIFHVLENNALIKKVAELLSTGSAVGWFSGRMEFGPRSLGARSIIADSRSSSMQKMLNLKIKYRESFRPFAPSVLSEDASEWFNLSGASPYMLIVADVNEDKRVDVKEIDSELFGIEKLNIARSKIPAVTHIDFSSRIQTVHKETNPKFYALIEEFKKLTGTPVLVNTSFNVRGEPIVCTPENAFKCFMGTELDILVIEDIILFKAEQNPALKDLYVENYELD
jgi:carbamoyltransferase